MTFPLEIWNERPPYFPNIDLCYQVSIWLVAFGINWLAVWESYEISWHFGTDDGKWLPHLRVIIDVSHSTHLHTIRSQLLPKSSKNFLDISGFGPLGSIWFVNQSLRLRLRSVTPRSDHARDSLRFHMVSISLKRAMLPTVCGLAKHAQPVLRVEKCNGQRQTSSASVNYIWFTAKPLHETPRALPSSPVRRHRVWHTISYYLQFDLS